MSNVASMVTFLKTCPYIDKPVSVLKVDKTPVNFSIDPIGNVQTIAEDVLGRKTKEFRFYITAMRKSDIIQNEYDTADFFENIIDWIEAQNDLKNFPTSDGLSIRVDNQPELYSKDPSLSTGIYQLLCTYTFLKEG